MTGKGGKVKGREEQVKREGNRLQREGEGRDGTGRVKGEQRESQREGAWRVTVTFK